MSLQGTWCDALIVQAVAESHYLRIHIIESHENFGHTTIVQQRAKKVVSDSPGLVDFAIGLVNSVLNFPDGQAKIFRRSKITKVL